MTDLADHLCPAAQRLIAVLGRWVTLRRQGATTYDPQSGTVTSSGTEVALKGLIEVDERTEGADLAGTLRLRLTLAADDLDPPPGLADLVAIDGTHFAVTAVTARHAGGRPALFTLHLRR